MLTKEELASLSPGSRPDVVARLVDAAEAIEDTKAMLGGKSKYRGTPTYYRVMAELILTAERRGVTTYEIVAGIMGLPKSGHHMSRELGQILWELAVDENIAGRPILGSVVVNVNGKVGPGFFWAARTLGRLAPDATVIEETHFLEMERLATYDAWARPRK